MRKTKRDFMTYIELHQASLRKIQGLIKILFLMCRKWHYLINYKCTRTNQSITLYHRVQRLITSKSAKRQISDNITVILKYFWQMTIARSEDINKVISYPEDELLLEATWRSTLLVHSAICWYIIPICIRTNTLHVNNYFTIVCK